MTFQKRGLGYKPDPHDPRDHKFAALRSRLLASPPLSHSLKQYVPDVLDQGAASSCVGNATAQGLRMLDRIASGNAPLVSRLFLYFFARAYTGDQHSDAGTYIRNCMRACLQFGFPPEMYWEYNLDNVNREPAFDSEVSAFPARLLDSYHRIDSTGDARIRDIQSAIASGSPVVFGTDVSNDFVSTGHFTEILHAPRPSDVAGGHCMVAVGYDSKSILICGSYGPGHGDLGFYHFSYDYMIDPRTNDIWALVKN